MMPSITSWTRVEPVPRTADLEAGLRAEIADPLWMLARQHQVGELSGEDAGSPIETVVTVEIAPVSRFHPGPVGAGSAAASSAVDVDDRSNPWEVLVECRPLVGSAADVRVRFDAGQHLLRLLTLHGAATAAKRFVGAFPLTVPEPPALDTLGMVASGVPDGRAVAEALVQHRGTSRALVDVPSVLRVPVSSASKVVRAANDFLAFWSDFVREPVKGADAWVPDRLEYGFAFQASLSDGAVTMRADDYRGGRLDWAEFEVDSRTGLGTPSSGATSRTLVRRMMPSRAFYGGMPAERFWEFENATVRFGSESVGRADIAHQLLDEFALTYGNDWWVVPLRIDTGSVCAMRDLRIIDTFGVETRSDPAAMIGSSSWSMFDLSTRPGSAARVSNLCLVPAALGASQQSDPVDEVGWFRDEMANLVWAVERRLEGVTGGSRTPESRSVTVAGQQPVGPIDDAELIYRLNSNVPENWYPLVPVRPLSAPAGVVHLELRGITRFASDGSAHTPTPTSRFLSAGDPLVIQEEEVPRDGVTTRAHWQLTRGWDGRYHLWLSNQVTPGRGEGSSGLVFDVTRPLA